MWGIQHFLRMEKLQNGVLQNQCFSGLAPLFSNLAFPCFFGCCSSAFLSMSSSQCIYISQDKHIEKRNSYNLDPCWGQRKSGSHHIPSYLEKFEFIAERDLNIPDLDRSENPEYIAEYIECLKWPSPTAERLALSPEQLLDLQTEEYLAAEELQKRMSGVKAMNFHRTLIRTVDVSWHSCANSTSETTRFWLWDHMATQLIKIVFFFMFTDTWFL
jgi:hypothetical protein